MKDTTLRKIIHIDMDAFYASVEQRDNPALRGRPIAVGHPGGRSVVCTASYEARRFGVRSAMPATKAGKLCPELIFVEPRFEVYKQVSGAMHDIFHEYTDIIEPISLDEAFLDVTENKPGIPLAVTIAKEIKAKIRNTLGLTASAGVSYNKFLAKIASDYRKPDGLFTIHPDLAVKFISKLPVSDFWGVGAVTAEKMKALGLHTGADLAACPIEILHKEFGKLGYILYQFARGIDNRPVRSTWERKSLGCETTLARDISSTEEIETIITELAEELEGRVARKNFSGTTLTLKLKYSDISTRSRSKSRREPFRTREEIFRESANLLTHADLSMPVRLVGLSVSVPDSSPQRQKFDPRQLVFDFDDTTDFLPFLQMGE